jgi:hypothetical protein
MIDWFMPKKPNVEIDFVYLSLLYDCSYNHKHHWYHRDHHDTFLGLSANGFIRGHPGLVENKLVCIKTVDQEHWITITWKGLWRLHLHKKGYEKQLNGRYGR